MKIAIIANRNFRYQTTHPLDLAKVFAEEGMQVTIIAPIEQDVADLYKNSGFQIIHLSPKSIFFRLAELFRLLRRIRPEIVIAYEQTGLVYSFLSYKWWNFKCKFVYYANELSRLAENERGWATIFQYFFARYSDFVITGGIHRAQIMQQDWKLRRLPYILTNTLTHPQRSHSNLLFQKSSILKQGDIIVLYASSLDECTCVLELIRSVRYWGKNTKLILCGYGNKDYIDQIIHEIDVLGLQKRVEYIGKFSNKQAVFELVEQCDIGIVLRNYHKFNISNMVYYTPGKLMEYAAFGKPCICSDNVSLKPFAEEGWVFCVAPTDVKMIAEKVNLLSSDPVLRARMSDKALRLFEEKYCMEIEGRKLLSAIKKELFES